jgi:hypothetical protein
VIFSGGLDIDVLFLSGAIFLEVNVLEISFLEVNNARSSP